MNTVLKLQFFQLVPNHYHGELVNRFLQSVGGFDKSKADYEILKLACLHILPYEDTETVKIADNHFSGRSATLQTAVIERYMQAPTIFSEDDWPQAVKYFDPDAGSIYAIHDGHHRLAAIKQIEPEQYVGVEVWDITDALKKFIKETPGA